MTLVIGRKIEPLISYPALPWHSRPDSLTNGFNNVVDDKVSSLPCGTIGRGSGIG